MTERGTTDVRAGRQDEWRHDVWWWATSAVVTGAAFWIGQGWVMGVITGGAVALIVLVLHLGRRRSDALRVLGGAGDERNQLLAARATSAAGAALVLTMTVWFLVSAFRGEVNQTLMILLPLYLVLQAVASAWHARQS